MFTSAAATISSLEEQGPITPSFWDAVGEVSNALLARNLLQPAWIDAAANDDSVLTKGWRGTNTSGVEEGAPAPKLQPIQSLDQRINTIQDLLNKGDIRSIERAMELLEKVRELYDLDSILERLEENGLGDLGEYLKELTLDASLEKQDVLDALSREAKNQSYEVQKGYRAPVIASTSHHTTTRLDPAPSAAP